MYQLWGPGGGTPFSYDPTTNTATDGAGTVCRLLGAVPEIWEALHRDPALAGARVAIASRTDEPAWARELLSLLRTSGGTPLMDVVEPGLDIMMKGSKRDHFRLIQQTSGVPFQEMVFFDDDPHNIKEVKTLGVCCKLTPDGVTRRAWDEALSDFSKCSRTS